MSEERQIIEPKSDTNELTQQIANLMRNSENVVLGFKLHGNNYPLWARLMKVAIGSRGRSGHITGQPPPPKPADPNYNKWEETDLAVFSWLLQNMEGKLVMNFAQHQTAKAVWDSLAVTYGSGATDPLQIYDLEVKANKVNQGQLTLEDYWNELQAIWLNIDRREPNPLDCCEKGITKYQKLIESRRLYQFLSGLDSKYDHVRRDILKEIPAPSAESAFSKVRREAARLQILQPATNHADIDASSSGGVGAGLAAVHRPTQRAEIRPPHTATIRNNPPRSGNFQNRKKEDKSKLYCTHCGMNKHTKEMCFQIVGYPEWWEDNNKIAKGKMADGSGATPTGTTVAENRPAWATVSAAMAVDRLAAGTWGAREMSAAGDQSPLTVRAAAPAVMRPAAAEVAEERPAVQGGRKNRGGEGAYEGGAGYQDGGDYWTWH
ncbi:uncharacterized protein LOC130991349 [Salvia miltiorrhiza]|uniref:uncharacterized protein LOC130991349 n=1 Tax=Salvia miltiorrhiza TaxID=226208 RepID=UPI0025AC5D3B|nr:uncharacterized protein LOC130991349 [Salvia miltiorrhiza]